MYRLDLNDPQDTSSYNPMDLVAAIESKSTHPLADAIVSAAVGCIAEMEQDFLPCKKIKVIEGLGLSGQVKIGKEWKHVVAGNERLLLSHGGTYETTIEQDKLIESFIGEYLGSTIVVVAIDENIELVLAITDEIREESKEFVNRIYQQGMDVTMLTGDHPSVAKLVCESVSINSKSNCFARLLPHEKLEWIQNIQKEQKKHIMMIGDGINDVTG